MCINLDIVEGHRPTSVENIFIIIPSDRETMVWQCFFGNSCIRCISSYFTSQDRIILFSHNIRKKYLITDLNQLCMMLIEKEK